MSRKIFFMEYLNNRINKWYLLHVLKPLEGSIPEFVQKITGLDLETTRTNTKVTDTLREFTLARTLVRRRKGTKKNSTTEYTEEEKFSNNSSVTSVVNLLFFSYHEPHEPSRKVSPPTYTSVMCYETLYLA